MRCSKPALKLAPHPVGSKIWVKETHRPVASGEIKNGEGKMRYGVAYLADQSVIWSAHETIMSGGWSDTAKAAQFDPPKWKPSIFMRKSYSRITLEVTEVKVERLQDISKQDCIAEGLFFNGSSYSYLEKGSVPYLDSCWSAPHQCYKNLWEGINGKGSWALNPWVWAYTFRVLNRR
jgi:hypothetical protein